jgi:starvation-inducible DNA-binding protein
MHHRSSVDLPSETHAQLIDLLNGLVASSIDLFTQIKHAHWNVKGAQFISLHELFDTLADHAREHSDLLAERVVILGGYAKGTARLAVEHSGLPELEFEDALEAPMVQALVAQFARTGQALRHAIDHAGEDLKDPVTEDILVQILRQVEMDTWFLEAHLEGPQLGKTRAPQKAQGRPEGAGVRH